MAQRHEVLKTNELVKLNDASELVRCLAKRIEQDGVCHAAPLIENATIGKDNLIIALSSVALSQALDLRDGNLAPSLLRIKAQLHFRRRGAEMKIIAGSFKPTPDKAMIRALRQAHAWVRLMKAGASIRQVGQRANKSESYVAHIIPLAFLAPRIQQAILDGSQPLSLTLETLVRTPMPRNWKAQESIFGFGP